MTSTTQAPTQGVAAAAQPPAPGVGLPSGYVQLDDRSVLERMLSNIADNSALLAAVKAHHTMDAGGPLMQAFSRLVGMEEAEAIEVRLIRSMIGGGARCSSVDRTATPARWSVMATLKMVVNFVECDGRFELPPTKRAGGSQAT